MVSQKNEPQNSGVGEINFSYKPCTVLPSTLLLLIIYSILKSFFQDNSISVVTILPPQTTNTTGPFEESLFSSANFLTMPEYPAAKVAPQAGSTKVRCSSGKYQSSQYLNIHKDIIL